jgi:hypothetical protein
MMDSSGMDSAIQTTSVQRGVKMHRFHLLIFAFLLIGFQNVYADSCDGSTTDCWDPCSGSYQVVAGNSCDTQWNSSSGCYQAVGDCTPNSSNSCDDQSTQCWDTCSLSYITFQNSNACTTAWSPSNGCYQALGYCSN